MKKTIVALSLLLFGAFAQADNGLVIKPSAHSVQETLDRLQSIVSEKGFTVFARIDHAAGAGKVGQTLRPTQLLIFGNPKAGTPLMQSNQTAGIDLPVKALAWEDESGKVFLAYNNPSYLVDRHEVSDRGPLVEKMTGALKNLTDAATSP